MVSPAVTVIFLPNPTVIKLAFLFVLYLSGNTNLKQSSQILAAAEFKQEDAVLK